MCPFQRPKKTTRSNSTSEKASGTFAPKVLPSVQRQSAQTKPLAPFQPSSDYSYSTLHEIYGHPQGAAIQPRSWQQPGNYQGWQVLQRSPNDSPTSSSTPEMVPGKVSQQKSIAQLRRSLRPKRWEGKPVKPRGENNGMQLKAAAKLPLDSLQRVKEDTDPQQSQEQPVPSSVAATDVTEWIPNPEITGQFPDNPPQYRQEGDELIARVKNAIEDYSSEYYKIEIGENGVRIICRDGCGQDIKQMLRSSNMMGSVKTDDEGYVPTSNGTFRVDEDYVTIKASVNLNHFQLDPVSQGKVQIFGDFNGTPNPPRAEEMYNELLYHVNQTLMSSQSYSSVNVEIHKGTKNVKLVVKGEESLIERVIENLKSRVDNNLNVTYRDIFKQKKKFFKSKKQRKFSLSRNSAENQQSKYTISLAFLRPTDWGDISTQTANAVVGVGQADLTDIAQEEAFNNDNAYTIFDRFKMILQIMKGEGENTPETVSDLIGNSSSLWAWSVPGLNLLVILNKFLKIGTYSKRRKQLRKALTKTQEDLNADNVTGDKQDRLQKLQEAINYGIQKMKKLIVTLWVDAIASIVQLLSRIFTLLFPQIAIGTVFVDVAATATKLGSLLFRKGKGLYKHFKGTRGKKRYESAESIFSSALSGDEAGVMAIRALNIKTLMGHIGRGLSTATKKTGKGIGTTVGAGWSRLRGRGKGNPTVTLNKGGLDAGLSDKGKKQMQWGKWPSDAGDFSQMLQNVNSHPRPKLVFIKALSNELKSSL